MPPNLVHNEFAQYSTNIDINDSTVGGKDTSHATQVAVWQRGEGEDVNLAQLQPAKQTTFAVPQAMDRIISANIVEGKSMPAFPQNVDIVIFQSTEQDSVEAQTARATDMAFNVIRQDMDDLPSWTAFNQSLVKQIQK